MARSQGLYFICSQNHNKLAGLKCIINNLKYKYLNEVNDKITLPMLFLEVIDLPGRIMSVDSDNLSSPTTESERTGVYLLDIFEHVSMYSYLGFIQNGIIN